MRHPSGRRSTSTERRLRRTLAGLVLACGAFVLVHGSGRAGAAPPSEAELRQTLARQAVQLDLLEKRAALANSDSFYLLLDLQNSRLVLKLQGAVLRDYHFDALEVGEPRIAFRARHLAGEWQGRIWKAGNLDPPRDRERTEIVPPDSVAAADSTQPFKLPPTPEEAYPVPPRYHVRYTGGLSLEVRLQELEAAEKRRDRLLSTLVGWYHDLREALSKAPQDTIRLRLVLQPQDAASLYRALPPDTQLLILPPAS